MNEIKNLLKVNGIKHKEVYMLLGMDKQKFDRWSEDDHPNNKVLRAAVKFVLRCMIETDQVRQKKIQQIKTAEEQFKERMDAIGL